ncbi:helix-turn-helix domain-containing protein [Streptomyces sp. L-9-10]|uniref:helix-turn-helix domain-containing protein n=1 Tax=Streptomyces sp. L-9-10 TaxID=1478131 RepID=UPI001F00D0C3|nr:helix-turn-helix domain-containing protein [Streptomyces sp. L-9-10]
MAISPGVQPIPQHIEAPGYACTPAVHTAVAAALDVDRRTVYRFIAAGDLPVVDLRTGPGRSRVRVPSAGLDEFISRRAVAMPTARR